MTPERWKRTEELYHAARDRPRGERGAFLAEACPDEELRREVELLLEEPVSDDGAVAPPALARAAATLADRAAAPLRGRSIGTYRLESLLGAGGMGEVYRARDIRLGRDVAIKVLPAAFTSHPERLARLEREARMLASLSHPGICGIHGIEEADGMRLLVLELVEGMTLAERLARCRRDGAGGLPLGAVLLIARQLAEALEAAHEKGIVHRDLKPENIKITPDGVAKILDFGLAKTVAGDNATPGLTVVPTGTGAGRIGGAVIGTAAYMSPEQARGLPVDKRTDIWAFGCVLYEMLTGIVAFAGQTVSDSIAKVLEREPDWSALPATTPPGVRRLLTRTLTKDPKQRLRDIGDVRIEIDAIDDVLAQSAVPAAPAEAATARMTWWLWVAVAVVAGLIASGQTRPPATVQEGPLANAQFGRLMNWEGMEGGAEISPDGKFVAFIADRDGELNLWVGQVGTGNFQNLTTDLPALDSPGGLLRIFGFTGDGGELWFTQAGDASAPKFRIPLTGGTPRAFLGQGAAAPSWSPDDTRLVYFTNGAGDPFSIADRTSANAHPMAVDDPGFFAGTMHNHNPVWSPDGEWIYFAHGPEPTAEMNVWRVKPAGGTPEQLTALRAAANHLAILDPRTVLYVARADDGTGPWLWSLDVESKVTRRVTSGLPEHYSTVSASRDGRRIVATLTNPTASLWTVPLLDRQADDRDVVPYPLPNARALSPRFGGTSLFYLSGQAGRDGVWRLQDGSPSEVWRPATDSVSEPPAVSRDGARVAIVARQDGHLRLTVMSAAGTNARTLAPDITIVGSGGQGSADWSPDGRRIVVAGSQADREGLFTIPVDGGAPVRIVSGRATNPVWSPDGRVIVYSGPVVGGQVPLLGVTPEGTPVELPEVRAGLTGGHRFVPDGSGLVYLPRSQSRDFWLLDLATKTTRAVTRISDRGTLQSFDISPDGKSIVFGRSLESSDIVLIELPK